MTQFAELCFLRTWQAVAFPARRSDSMSLERRERMNDWLLSAQETGWLDWERMDPGTLALAVLVTRRGASLRRRLKEVLGRHDHGNLVGNRLFELLRDRRDVIAPLCFHLDDDADCQGLVLEAMRSRFRGLSKLITVWMNLEITTNLTSWLRSIKTDAKDSLGRPVAPTPIGLTIRLVDEVHEQIFLPDGPEVIGGMILRRLIDLVARMPPRQPFPSWHGMIDAIERNFLDRTIHLDDQERFVLMSTVYGGFTTDEIAIALQRRRHTSEARTPDEAIAAERIVSDVLWNAWRAVFRGV